MKTYIEKEPVFSDSIQLTETTDPGNAEYINIATKQIFANTLVNQKEIREGDSKNKIITFDSMDSKKADKWTDVAMMESGEKHKSLIEKISIMFKNVRYLYKLLGTTDISKIEDGTVTGAIKKVNKALKPIDAENRIEEMTSINQITSVGFWKIATIENNYAHEIGIDNNVGDFYAIVSNYNGNGTDRYTFGDLLLFSPRLQGYHYAINIWNENAQARLVLTNDNILTTKEQINANTDLRNIAGATAMKEMFSEINSNLAWKYKKLNIPLENIHTEIDISNIGEFKDIIMVIGIENITASNNLCDLSISNSGVGFTYNRSYVFYGSTYRLGTIINIDILEYSGMNTLKAILVKSIRYR